MLDGGTVFNPEGLQGPPHVNPIDVLDTIDHIPERLEETLSSISEFDSRSPRLAHLLHELCPWASLSACLLVWGEQSYPGASTNHNHSSELLDQIQSTAGAAPEDRARAWRALLGGANSLGLVEEFAVSGHCYGLVGLRLSHELDSVERRMAMTILKGFAGTLSLLLRAEDLERDGKQAREELQEQERLANTGELAGAVAHEFTNFLNLLLLQVSMLEFQLPAADHADLAEIRRQGNAAAEVVRHFLDYRRGHAPALRLLDLNAILTEVAGELTRDPPTPVSLVLASDEADGDSNRRPPSLQLSLAADLPSVRSSRPEMLRLARFLIGNALRAAGVEGDVQVRTSRSGAGVRLQIDDSGAQVSEEDLPYFFDPGRSRREGAEGLELAACRSMVRRLRGNLHAENRSEEGIRVVVDLPGEPGA
jgi:signal transduction histidine kinase